MHIIQTIQDWDILHIFTDDPEHDVLAMKEEYKNGNSNKIHLWYWDPVICLFDFLWVRYPCIELWFDNEYDILDDTKDYLDNIITY